jgi:HSP20 family protein
MSKREGEPAAYSGLAPGEGGKLLRSERYFGSVSRAFTFGQDVDQDKTQPRYADGVLTLELPKKAGATGREMTVQ